MKAPGTAYDDACLGKDPQPAPGHIWYDALRSPQLTTTATFRQFARITQQAARQRFGSGSDEAKAVREAWAQVGVR
jgi:Zn-dependent metalloprotease